MLRVLRITTYGAGGLAVLILFAGFAGATGAPQEAVVAALAIAVVMIPYALTATAQRSRIVRLLEREADRQNELEGAAAADRFSADNLRRRD